MAFSMLVYMPGFLAPRVRVRVGLCYIHALPWRLVWPNKSTPRMVFSMLDYIHTPRGA